MMVAAGGEGLSLLLFWLVVGGVLSMRTLGTTADVVVFPATSATTMRS